MDLQTRIIELEETINRLIDKDAERESTLNVIQDRVDFAFKNVDLIFERMGRKDELFDALYDFTVGWTETFKEHGLRFQDQIINLRKANSSIRDEIAILIYKIFPEAELADEALDRIERAVNAERAEQRNKSNE